LPTESGLVDREGILARLQWSLQALACEAEVQLSLYPDFACKVDELALDYDNWRKAAVGNFGDEFSSESLRLLAAIDEKLSTMSKGGVTFDNDLWTPRGLKQSSHWRELRDMARASLETLGWPATNPGKSPNTYVKG
jgi:hypothetical protein